MPIPTEERPNEASLLEKYADKDRHQVQIFLAQLSVGARLWRADHHIMDAFKGSAFAQNLFIVAKH